MVRVTISPTLQRCTVYAVPLPASSRRSIPPSSDPDPEPPRDRSGTVGRST
jgi:hypothetical protein